LKIFKQLTKNINAVVLSMPNSFELFFVFQWDS